MKMRYFVTIILITFLLSFFVWYASPDIYEASRTLAFIPEGRSLSCVADGNSTDYDCGENLYGYIGGSRSNFVAEVFRQFAMRRQSPSSGVDSKSMKHSMPNLEVSFAMRNYPVMCVRIKHSNSNIVEEIATCCVSAASHLIKATNKRRSSVSAAQIKEMVKKQKAIVDSIKRDKENGLVDEYLLKKLAENQVLLDSLQKQLEFVENSNVNGLVVSEVVSDRVYSHYVGKLWF